MYSQGLLCWVDRDRLRKKTDNTPIAPLPYSIELEPSNTSARSNISGEMVAVY